MDVVINGKRRAFDLTAGATVHDLLGALGLKQDRVAVEQNGSIVGRADWEKTTVTAGDRFEIVHFVGGGCGHGEACA